MAKVTVIPQKVNAITHIPTNTIRKVRVAAYARVSTKQEEQVNSYEAQIDYYTKYIAKRPDWEFVGMYSDKGITGTSRKHRVGFNKMIDDALNGKIDKIIMKSVQRFARNTLDTIGLARQLKEKGVEVYFEETNTSTLDTNGELSLTIMASIAQEESRNISENVKWGKKKRYAEGYTSCGYKNFLGYDKHPTDAKKGFIINEEQAKVVRLIYKLFLQGKTLTAIAKFLEESGYKTPMGKDKWLITTLESILKNEKYKGDACIRKTYVKDFLSHKLVKNNGEVDSYYVEDHHDPIINPDEWEMVQAERKRRKALNGTYGCSSTFSSRLICGDCGSFYGQKVWHSTDKYRKLIYRCNGKFDKTHQKCQTPTLDEETIKKMFLKVYANFMSDRTRVVSDCNDMIDLLCNTAEFEEEIRGANDRVKDIIVLVENLIAKNAREAMPQDTFQAKYNEYDEEHQKLLSLIEKDENIIQEKNAKAKYMKAFVKDLENRPLILEEWDEGIWNYMIDKATVNKDGTITFLFRNGREITVD